MAHRVRHTQSLEPLSGDMLGTEQLRPSEVIALKKIKARDTGCFELFFGLYFLSKQNKSSVEFIDDLLPLLCCGRTHIHFQNIGIGKKLAAFCSGHKIIEGDPEAQ